MTNHPPFPGGESQPPHGQPPWSQQTGQFPPQNPGMQQYPAPGQTPSDKGMSGGMIALIVFTVLAVLGAVATGGFLLLGDDDDGDKKAKSETSKTPSETTDEPEEPTDQPDSGDGLAFGKTFKDDSGVEFTISKPEPFTPSSQARGYNAGDEAVKVDVTIKNGSSQPIRIVYTLIGAGATEADARGSKDYSVIVDEGVTGGFTDRPLEDPELAPGESDTGSYGISIPKDAPKKLVVIIVSTNGAESTYWEGNWS